MTKDDITRRISEAEAALTKRYSERGESQRYLDKFQAEVKRYQGWVNQATADIEELTSQLEILNLANEAAK